jgi:hypothetical protein
MTKDEALDLALEALGLYQAAGFGNSTDFNKQHEAFYKAQTAIIAIKQACALDKKAENARELGLDYEPDEWMTGCPECGIDSGCDCDSGTWNPPAQPAPVQEPVAWRFTGIAGFKRFVTDAQHKSFSPEVRAWYEPFKFASCTTPPAAQRQWVGLSDEEYVHITDTVFHQGRGLVAYYLAIEAKLKERNV